MSDTQTKNDGNWTIELKFDNAEPLRLNVDSQLVLGRPVATEPSQIEGIDLTPYGADKLGVSRKHAAIRWQGPQLFIYDMDSANGTILNGNHLRPSIGYRLSTGDELYLGHLRAKITLNDNTGPSSIKGHRFELQMDTAPLVGQNQRILVVEDDPIVSTLYKTTLENSGFTIQVVRDVVGAMRSFGQQTPSLILLDIMLPGVHGLELARYIRRDADGPQIPIVVASAITDPAAIKNAIDDGVDVYMSKPINIRELARVASALIYRNERQNPSGVTKQLRGTASLDAIAAEPRNDTIILFVEGHREPIGAIVKPQLTVGRNVVNQGRTHVDLEPYGAFDKGVSRIHARFTRNGQAFFIEDMESSNGTYVNGKSLGKGESAQVRSGDEVRLGDMRMRVYLLADTGSLSQSEAV